jgi:hypothetical protein
MPNINRGTGVGGASRVTGVGGTKHGNITTGSNRRTLSAGGQSVGRGGGNVRARTFTGSQGAHVGNVAAAAQGRLAAAMLRLVTGT